MQHNTLIIVGGGPRGLACAIQGLTLFNRIYIIDETPAGSWNTTSTVANFELRSPVSFDLVTYDTSNKDYSLSDFLDLENITFNNQKEIEEDSRRLTRLQFYNYLSHVKTKLMSNSNVSFIYNKVLSVHNNCVETTSGKIHFDHLILAQGTQEKAVPTNLLPYKKITNEDLLTKSYSSLLVVGSGQGAYDIASYLYNKGVNVGLYITKYPKIDQYPAPSYSLWKERSALGNYCSSLVSTASKSRYIQSVKAWGPSITPNNEYLLTTIPIYINSNIKEVISKYNNTFISRVGVKPNNILNIKPDQITTNFKVKGTTNMFVSGPITAIYDGPRVNSIISSSSTAIKIMEEIDASI
jgi:lysine/ornithine N-monooxygenase